MFCCPLCEENISNCECGFGSEKENDKSITLSSEDDRLVCGDCGVVTKNCLCNFQCHNLNLDSGICSKCGVFQPGNQLCSAVELDDDIITSTQKTTKEGVYARRKIFKELRIHYVTTS